MHPLSENKIDEDILELMRAAQRQNTKAGAGPAMNVAFNPDRYGVERVRETIQKTLPA
jgi:hypothetical protein